MLPAVGSKTPFVHSPEPKQLYYSPLLHTEIASSIYLASGFSVIRWINVDGIKPKQIEDPSGISSLRTNLYSSLVFSSSKKYE